MAMGIVIVKDADGDFYASMVNCGIEVDAKENVEGGGGGYHLENFIRYPSEGENDCVDVLSSLYALNDMGSVLDDLISVAFEAGRDFQRSVIRKELLGE